MHLNRDALTAIVLLLVSAIFFAASFVVPEPMFGQMSPALWPRVILIPLAILSALLLVRSQLEPLETNESRGGLTGWLKYYQNPIVCFGLFFLFLLTMPVLGMLIGGLIYVFLTLCVLGGWGPRQLALHAAISAVCVVGMWAIFTLGLGVFLPEGEILRVY